MNETTLLRPNNDRIVLHRHGSGWRVSYYAATRIRGRWFRQLFGAPALLSGKASSPAQVQAILVRANIHLTRAEVLRLNTLMNMQQKQTRGLART